MDFIPKEKLIRKIIPIHERLNAVNFLNLSKKFSTLCGSTCTCKLFTDSKKNQWTFKYFSNNTIDISIRFCHDNLSTTPYVYIDTFYVNSSDKDSPIEDTILKLIVSNVKNLDFHNIVLRINSEDMVPLFLHNNFKRSSFNELSMSLKTRFIPF
ncbi:MAG: hypothetical protein N4A57_16980 [Anaeromicrobium sp.]|jgi:hypothetical protein|uniref:hypothetical protein n=1 Tax=Anaeromicrobium sp. TaxID=1929132 RepID=UPI0025D38E7F|nr:hypothetical protein [Anaeromicrobium sp.]MCT4595942.1 hypothetical protein [Anaeromicrobium sp.]